MERTTQELTPSALRGSAAALVRRPWLWRVALVQAFRLAPAGWWRRWPPVPRPDPAYLRFRMQTQYGDPDHPADGADLVEYLKWCRTERRHLG